MRPLLVFLLLVLIPAYGQPLSDRTGLVNTLEVDADGSLYEVRIVGNFDVERHGFGAGTLTVHISSSLDENIGELVLPHGLLQGEPELYLDGGTLDAKVVSNERVSFVTVVFGGAGDHVLEVTGSEYAGDAGPRHYLWAAGIILAAAAAAAVAWRRKTKR